MGMEVAVDMTTTERDDLALDYETITAQCADAQARVERRLACGHYAMTRSSSSGRCSACGGARIRVAVELSASTDLALTVASRVRHARLFATIVGARRALESAERLVSIETDSTRRLLAAVEAHVCRVLVAVEVSR